MTLSVAIMTDRRPERRRWFDALVKATVAAGFEPFISVDNGRGLWETAWAAWFSSDPRASHHLVLQDDIQLCPGFFRAVEMCISERPDEALSFFSARDFAASSRWVAATSYASAQALCLPVGMVGDFLDWESRMCDPNCQFGDDIRLQFYLLATGRYLWHTQPSLVQHLAGVPAVKLATIDASTIDWSETSTTFIDGDAKVVAAGNAGKVLLCAP